MKVDIEGIRTTLLALCQWFIQLRINSTRTVKLFLKVFLANVNKSAIFPGFHISKYILQEKCYFLPSCFSMSCENIRKPQVF